MSSCELIDDEEDLGGLYENGHWEWDEKSEGLQFMTNQKLFDEDSWISPPPAAIIGGVAFKDDIDVLEQQRFKKRFQRRTIHGDVVNLQDIKDVVLFTAPPNVLSPSVVRILHLPGTERFLRALIFYIQYYIQISEEMSRRVKALETTLRTSTGVEVERRYKENLEDLRVLIAKEYSTILTGGGDYKKFHHMGAAKKMRSLSKRSNILFESLIRIAIQIVWLALGRKCFNLIELEMHRLFKTPKFNMVEHQRKTNYIGKMSAQERYVLFGECIQNERMLKTHSPLMNEITCRRGMDCRLLGLGVVNYPNLSHRLQYMQDVLIAPEFLLPKIQVSVGILGLRRSRFDIMLKEIVSAAPTSASSIGMKQPSFAWRSMTRPSRLSLMGTRKSFGTSGPKNVASFTTQFPDKLVADIELPWRDSEQEVLPSEFPSELLPQNPCDQHQKQKWVARAARLTAIRSKRHALKIK